MKIKDLLNPCAFVQTDPFGCLVHGADTQIDSITSDSRAVVQGGLFIAVQGHEADGHQFISSALEKGAAAVVAQSNPQNLQNVVLVKNSRIEMARIAANFYGHPSEHLTLIGITGTNGKTTTSYLCESILTAAGFNTGVIGTVDVRYNGQSFDTPVTTPDAIDLQKTLNEMKQAGVTHVVMEVSSHALDLYRVEFCRFNMGIFTNLTQDHLDYHTDMETYFQCKKRFFKDFLAPSQSVINIDDPYGKKLQKELKHGCITISTQTDASLYAQNISDTINGLSASFNSKESVFEIHSDLTGIFNLENILCATAMARLLNIKQGDIQTGIQKLKAVPGRLEKISNSIGRFLFVDYAHTPDALKSILENLTQRAPGRVISVFGCGGDRDRKKRPLMGEIACRLSDIAIVTSDNPRTENPENILKDIIEGLGSYKDLTFSGLGSTLSCKGYIREIDRKKAIALAIGISKPKDIIVVAGKGHETYQILNTGKIHFDDREELKKAADNHAEKLAPIPWTLNDITTALGVKEKTGADAEEILFSGISTDSRTIRRDQVFLALSGENFDGHTFIDPVIEKGVKAFIVQKNFWEGLSRVKKETYQNKQLSFFTCEDTLTALGRLARFQRRRAGVKVLAITGSSGKTTTRKICEEIFQTGFETLATSGNLNNEIGVPLTLLKLSSAHEWAIIEMGMNHPGEISRLTNIAEPDIAMVLNTAGVHLEGLGTIDNVAHAKAEIFEGLKEGGIALLPGFDPRIKILESHAQKNSRIKQILYFGDAENSSIKAEEISTGEAGIRFSAVIDKKQAVFELPSPGFFLVNNSLAAILAARCAEIPVALIQKGIRTYTPVAGRMNISVLTDQITLIDDTYNANPASVSSAIDTLKHVSGKHQRIAVLGDMLELGEASGKLHEQIGVKAAKAGISKLFVYGTQVVHLVNGAVQNGMRLENIYHGEKAVIAKKILEHVEPGAWILVKGSRGMAMEQVINELKRLIAD